MQKLPACPVFFASRKRCGVYKTEGIILKATDQAELDRLLTVYTKERGKILVRAISARKRESKLKGLLVPFGWSQFLLARSRTIDIVTDVQPVDNFSHLRQGLERLALAFYFSELIDRLVVAPEPDEALWQLILKAFEVLDDLRYQPQKIKTAFETRLLEVLGYGQAPGESPLDFIQDLVGQEIKSVSFLRELSFIN